jgi:hypothetical protein
MRSSCLCLLLFVLPTGAAEITITKTDTHLEFQVGTELITKYQYAGTVQLEKAEGTKPLAKPYFFPLNAPGGISATRGWPMVRGNPKDMTDHFHQKSVWFCHGDVIPEGVTLKTRSSDKRVHGVDFWAESTGHGRIVCTKVGKPNGGSVETKNEWRTPDEVAILEETRTITVSDHGAGRLIVLDITLTANHCPITFGDTKEGAMGIRISDEIQAKTGNGTITSNEGKVATAPAKDNLAMWGQPADWHDYSGKANEKEVGISIFDDPKNKHRSLWHTRAYGLMSANPFGRKDSGFPAAKGNAELVKLAKGESLKLRYGVYVHTGNAKAGKVADAFGVFAK